MTAQTVQPLEALETIVIKTGSKWRDIEKTVILNTLRLKRYNRTHTAKTLGIGVRTLQRKLKRYGLAHLDNENQAAAS